ncbi:MAG TPA: FGGY-family carbohydrate kinase, partial [Burkholderiaceae bacterium]|nr:FGGY-family carbohydrate kinase [Burkholderiaceae bacterium]
FGLTHAHGPADIGYAVMEGVSFGLLDGWNVLDEGDRRASRSLDVVGGGSRSASWASLLATLLDRPLVRREGAEAGAALGAARLGWLAAGGDLETVCAKGAAIQTLEPDASARAPLMARYARFAALYPVLRNSFPGRGAS